MGTNTAMRWGALVAQDETAVQHKAQCIPAGSGDHPGTQRLAVQGAITRLTGPPFMIWSLTQNSSNDPRMWQHWGNTLLVKGNEVSMIGDQWQTPPFLAGSVVYALNMKDLYRLRSGTKRSPFHTENFRNDYSIMLACLHPGIKWSATKWAHCVNKCCLKTKYAQSQSS